MPVRGEDFRHALGHFASGVTVVTSADTTRLAGLTVSAFSSVSLTPPYILVCIDKRSSALDVIRAAQAFAVNILSADQADVSGNFASRSDDKFAKARYHSGVLNQPILEGTLAHVECKLVQEVDAGDHFIYLGEVEAATVDDSKLPLVYYHGQYRELVNGS